jgi:hypothetical protein
MAHELMEFAPRHPGILFAAACGYALCIPAVAPGQAQKQPAAADQTLQRDYTARAVEAFRQAVAHGYRDTRGIQGDPDLEPVRSDARYKLLIAELTR